jgi:TPR repeat protein
MKLARACAFLAAMYLGGKLGEKNIVRARKYFARACGMSLAAGCYKLGRMYCDGGELPRNDEACATHLKKGCRLGSRKACSFMRSLGQRKRP